jgi:hypothetical protein
MISICDTITMEWKDLRRAFKKSGTMLRLSLSQAVKPSSINSCWHLLLENKLILRAMEIASPKPQNPACIGIEVYIYIKYHLLLYINN